MLQQVAQNIVRLLTDHNCVIVPGFGGFVTNYQSAKVHPTSFIFNSPSKSVAFNVKLTTNDGLLADTIAREEKLTHQEAEQLIAQFVAQINSALFERKPVKLAGIGRLTMDVENNIQFLPDNSQNLLPQSYGLYSFTAQPVVRDIPVEVKPLKPVTTAAKKPKKRTSIDRILPYAAVLLIAMTIMQIFIATSMNGFDYAEIFGLNKLMPQRNFILEKYEPVKFDINPSITYFRRTDPTPADTLQKDSLTQVPVQNAPSVQEVITTKFVLIAGSVFTDAAVDEILSKVAPGGYTGYSKPWGKYKLAAINIPDNVNPATFRADFIAKTGIKDAWVTRNQ